MSSLQRFFFLGTLKFFLLKVCCWNGNLFLWHRPAPRRFRRPLQYNECIKPLVVHFSICFLVPLAKFVFLTHVWCQASSGTDPDTMSHSFLVHAWLKSWLGACAAAIQVSLQVLMQTAVTPVPVEASYPIGRRVQRQTVFAWTWNRVSPRLWSAAACGIEIATARSNVN